MDTPYATLVKAAQTLKKGELLERWPNVSIDRVEKYLETNRPELDRVQEALCQKPSVPVEYHPDWLSGTKNPHRELCRLAFVFCVEIHLWAHRREFSRAAEIGIKGLEYCNALRRGGLVLDAIIANGCASPILQQVNRIRTTFNSKVRRHLIDELDRIESERESFASVEERDQRWETAVNALLPDTSAVDRLIDDLEASHEIFVDEKKRGTPTADLRDWMKQHYLFVYADELGAPIEEQRARMKQVYLDDRDRENYDPPRKQSIIVDLRSLCLIRMLVVDLLVRSFKEERGHYPDRLEPLTVPGGRTCPWDPLTSQPFIYRRKSTRRFLWFTNETFNLYSPGQKVSGQDGVFGSWSQVSDGVADLCLDWADYETNEWS